MGVCNSSVRRSNSHKLTRSNRPASSRQSWLWGIPRWWAPRPPSLSGHRRKGLAGPGTTVASGLGLAYFSLKRRRR
jgi:hypothetical protein